jgi:hypothetical protein
MKVLFLRSKLDLFIFLADRTLPDGGQVSVRCDWSCSLYQQVAAHFFTRSDLPITSRCVTLDDFRGRLLNELTQSQLSSGGLGTNTTSKQAALEPSCLATLSWPGFL